MTKCDQNTLLTNLNDTQADAVKTTEGPVLVLAGAGTGKTKVLTSRVAYLMQKGVFPGQMLVVTFTNKAAKEMKERIESLIEQSAHGIWLGTFHSIAARILRKHAPLVGLREDFTIIDVDDQLRLLKQILKEQDIDEKQSPAKTLSYIISRWKDLGLTPDKITAQYQTDFANGRATALYHTYQERLKSLNAADFGDLLLYNLSIFLQHPDILADYQHRFKYILVDEYQDTNISQYLWLRLLAQRHHNICCVGDDDQSIYGWRGAEVGNILRFEKDFPNATIIRLERNYRSTSHILGAASGLIVYNKGRLGKTLWTEANQGEPVQLQSYWDDIEEANAIADEIANIRYQQEITLSEIAILVRASFQTRTFEECFISRALPYKVVGGLRFYERMEIKDIIAYLRLVKQPYDLLAFERIANVPKRGIGTVSLQQIIHTARGFNLSVVDAVTKLLQERSLGNKTSQGLLSFIEQIKHWHQLKDQLTLTQLTQQIVTDSGYLHMWQQEKSIENEGRIENVKELLNALADFSSLEEFLDHVSLVMDNEPQNPSDMIHIMTLHAAKGLEFDTVFLPGWEDGLFPHKRALDDSGTQGLEEERRLAYVGITRSKRRAYITFATRRRIFGRYQHNIPSRFISELPPEHVISTSQTQTSNRGGGSSHGRYLDPSLIEDSHTLLSSKTSSTPSFRKETLLQIGQRVFHTKFGYGKILNIDGNKLDIAFEKAGRKTIMDNFVEAA